MSELRTIRELRGEKGLRSIDMAKLLGISPSAYCDKEVGRRKFQPIEIVKICSLFGVDILMIKDFFTRKR